FRIIAPRILPHPSLDSAPARDDSRQTSARADFREDRMKDGLRFVDSDMHIMEPPDLFERYLDPKFKDRVSVPVNSQGKPYRGPAAGLIVVDGQQISDADLQQ